MTQIVIHQPLIGQLGGLLQPAALVDEQGKRIGHFIPSLEAIAEAACPYSAEELAANRAQQGGRSLAEIWKSIGHAKVA
jgi:hypothetical protein